MDENSDRTARAAGSDQPEASDPPRTTDEVIEAADDPASEKQRTGAEQAAENRELDPPA
jgi:hypothetical protein